MEEVWLQTGARASSSGLGLWVMIGVHSQGVALTALLNKSGLLPEEVLVPPSQRHKNATSDKKHPLQNFLGPATGKVLLPGIHPS